MWNIPTSIWLASPKDAYWWMAAAPARDETECPECDGTGCHWCQWTGELQPEQVDPEEEEI